MARMGDFAGIHEEFALHQEYRRANSQQERERQRAKYAGRREERRAAAGAAAAQNALPPLAILKDNAPPDGSSIPGLP